MEKTNFPQNTKMPLDQLVFDPENPRLPGRLHHADDEQVLDYLLEEGDLADLMISLGTQGYYDAEPLLVTRRKGDNNVYIVVEGNRRLAALKLLDNPDLATNTRKSNTVKKISNEAEHHPKEISVQIYNDRKDILWYLGYRHITGTKSWGAMQKAEYMRQLYESYLNKDSPISPEEALRKTTRAVATNLNYAKRTLQTLVLIKKAKEEGIIKDLDLDEKNINFSVFATGLSYSGIEGFLREDKRNSLDPNGNFSLTNVSTKNLKDLFDWLFRPTNQNIPRVSDSRKLKQFAKVLSTPEALAQFREGASLEIASSLTDLPDDTFNSSLQIVLANLKTAYRVYIDIKDLNQSHIEILEKANKYIKEMHKSIKRRISGKDDMDLD